MNVKNMKTLLLLFIFISFSCHSDQYSMKSIGKNIFKSIEISNQKLTIAEAQFTWIDSLANYGTGFCYGSIIKNNTQINLNNFCEFTDSDENKFWAKVNRISSELETGLGKQEFIETSEKYTFLLEKDCKYAVSFFQEINFLVELKCK